MIHLQVLRATSTAARVRIQPAAHTCCTQTSTATCTGSRISRGIFRSFSSLLSADPRYVDSTAAPANFSSSSALVYPEAISEQEADALVLDIQLRMKRRRYEKGHWDAVITLYKEVELPLPAEPSVGGSGGPQPLSNLSVAVIERIRNQLGRNHFGPDGVRDQEGRTKDQLPVQWIPCHGIDLKKEGQLTAHVDSVRYSGFIVAGLSLLSSSIMRLRPAAEYSTDACAKCDGGREEERQQRVYEPKPSEAPDDGHVDLYLPPRSLYVLSGVSRYGYTHEILDDGSAFEMQGTSGEGTGNLIKVRRDRRISVIFRDTKRV